MGIPRSPQPQRRPVVDVQGSFANAGPSEQRRSSYDPGVWNRGLGVSSANATSRLLESTRSPWSSHRSHQTRDRLPLPTSPMRPASGTRRLLRCGDTSTRTGRSDPDAPGPALASFQNTGAADGSRLDACSHATVFLFLLPLTLRRRRHSRGIARNHRRRRVNVHGDAACWRQGRGSDRRTDLQGRGRGRRTRVPLLQALGVAPPSGVLLKPDLCLQGR